MNLFTNNGSYLKPLLLIIACSILASCNSSESELKREDLFTLDIGRLDGEIDLFNDIQNRSFQKSSIVMSDGLFYISNSSGQKITRYNSYGDLLFMIYNKDTNPPLLELTELNETEPAITRWAVPYQLQNPGAIAVDSKKNIYVSDMLSADRHRIDTEDNALYDSLLLHFDANGRFIDYFGRQGSGGSPFPHIEKIFISVNDDFVVVSNTGTGRIVYWFSADGNLLHEIKFRNAEIPVPENRQEVFAALDGIAVSPDEKLVFIKVDYYREVFDETTSTRTGSVPDGCSLWAFSPDDNSYISEIEVPFYENVSGVRRRQNEELFYSLLGVLKEREALFSFPSSDGYSILLLKTDGTGSSRRRGFINVNLSELEYSDFTLSAEGVISALLSTEWEAKVVWWRTDKLRRNGEIKWKMPILK